MTPRALSAFAVLVGLAVCASAAQRPGTPPVAADARPFKTGIEVVLIPATVVDENGALVSGLPRDAFEVFEDGAPQTITHFDNARVPVSLGLLLDVSDSMHGQRIADARAAVGRFLFELLGPDDEFFVMAFNHEARLIAPWTNRPDRVAPALDALRPWGATAIYDAVLASLPEFATRSRTRASLVVISDGSDTASDASLREVRSALLRTDAFVYAVAIDAPDRRPINRTINPYALRELTDDTGGRTVVVRDTAELGEATARIAEDLNHQYVLGYTPTHKPDGAFHSIRVRSVRPGLKVRARRGYVGG